MAVWIAGSSPAMTIEEASHRADLVQRLDLLLGKAELLEHRIGVFAKLRRRRREVRRRTRQRHRLADQRELALSLAVDLLRDLKMLDLRVGEHFIDRIDRPERHAGF